MDQRTYNRLRSLIESRYRRELEALEAVWSLAKTGAPGADADAALPAALRLPHGKAESLVHWAAQTFTERFTLHDVRAVLANAKPEHARDISNAAISTVLRRMADQQQLEIIEAGKGKRPSVYQRITAEDIGPAGDDTRWHWQREE